MIVAKEFIAESGEEDNTASQDFDDNDDTDDTISFRDLPLDGANTSDGDMQDQKSSFDDHDQDVFEFFSEDLSSGIASSHSTDSIIFCGKLIPCNKDETKQQSLEITAKPKHTKESSSIFPSKFSRHVSKSSTNTSSELKQEKSNETRRGPVRAQKNNINDKNEYSSMRKLSNLSIWSMKSTGCYSFRIGVGKFPMEMELSEMRTRQSRRRPPRMFPSEDESQKDYNSSSSSSGRGKRGKNLWGVLRGKASLGCIPQI